MHSEARAHRLHMYTMFPAYTELVTFLAGSSYTMFPAYKELVTFLAGSSYTMFWAYEELVTTLAGSSHLVVVFGKDEHVANSFFIEAAVVFVVLQCQTIHPAFLVKVQQHLQPKQHRMRSQPTSIHAHYSTFSLKLHPALLVKVQQHPQSKQCSMVFNIYQQASTHITAHSQWNCTQLFLWRFSNICSQTNA